MRSSYEFLSRIDGVGCGWSYEILFVNVSLLVTCMFVLTVILIWRYHQKSIQVEEDEDTLKTIIFSSLTSTTSATTTTTVSEQIQNEPIDENRLDYWLTKKAKTIGINLTAILAPKRPGKYLVYVCHENCGGNLLINIH